VNSAAEWWTSLRPDFPASPTQSLDNAAVKLMNVISGQTPLESLGKWDQAMSCWRTFQASLWHPDTPEPWLGSWLGSGMTVSGIVYQLRKLVPRTSAGGGGALPTPQAMDAHDLGHPIDQLYQTDSGKVRFHSNQGVDGSVGLGKMAKTGMWPTPNSNEDRAERYTEETSLRHYQEGRQIHLSQAVRMWPTPRANKTSSEDEESWLARQRDGKVSTPPLGLAVKMWPTPAARDWRQGGFPADHRRNSPNLPTVIQEVGGQLNPAWVEWLMGLPIGWTGLEPLATESFQQWWQGF
jgi:hypothetical protein